MNDTTNRICPFCAETIKSAAKACPRCRQWLTCWSMRNPVTHILSMAVPMLAIMVAFGVAILRLMDRFENPRPFYSDFPHAIRILESRINLAQTDNGLRIYITGILTNDSSIRWNSVEMDCRFFDRAGTLVDAGTGYSFGSVAPNDDTAFRVAIAPTEPTNEYATYKISVSNARNAKSRF